MKLNNVNNGLPRATGEPDEVEVAQEPCVCICLSKESTNVQKLHLILNLGTLYKIHLYFIHTETYR